MSRNWDAEIEEVIKVIRPHLGDIVTGKKFEIHIVVNQHQVEITKFSRLSKVGNEEEWIKRDLLKPTKKAERIKL